MENDLKLDNAKSTASTEYAQGLREIADWLEANPHIFLPGQMFDVFTLNTKKEAEEVLRALKPCKKEYAGELFNISRKFGSITLRFVFYRNAVCMRRVVGTKEVEEQIIPAHTEDVIEWECGEPVLSVAEEAA
jgi:hypothetical protein